MKEAGTMLSAAKSEQESAAFLAQSFAAFERANNRIGYLLQKV